MSTMFFLFSVLMLVVAGAFSVIAVRYQPHSLTRNSNEIAVAEGAHEALLECKYTEEDNG